MASVLCVTPEVSLYPYLFILIFTFAFTFFNQLILSTPLLQKTPKTQTPFSPPQKKPPKQTQTRINQK